MSDLIAILVALYGSQETAEKWIETRRTYASLDPAAEARILSAWAGQRTLC